MGIPKGFHHERSLNYILMQLEKRHGPNIVNCCKPDKLHEGTLGNYSSYRINAIDSTFLLLVTFGNRDKMMRPLIVMRPHLGKCTVNETSPKTNLSLKLDKLLPQDASFLFNFKQINARGEI